MTCYHQVRICLSFTAPSVSTQFGTAARRAREGEDEPLVIGRAREGDTLDEVWDSVCRKAVVRGMRVGGEVRDTAECR